MTLRTAMLSSLLGLATFTPLLAHAHHSFAAEFDSSKVIHLEGTITKFQWVNPHSWIHMAITRSDGTKEEWRIEGGAPSLLLRRGWTKDSLPPGTRIIINAFPSRDGDRRASPRDISFPDGRKVDFGGSFDPGKEKTEEMKPASPAK